MIIPASGSEKVVTVKISGDNSEIMSCLDEIEKKVDLINAKLEKMAQLAQLSGQIKD